MSTSEPVERGEWGSPGDDLEEAALTVGLTTLEIRLASAPGVDAEEVERLTHRLRDELDDLDVESVDVAAAGPASPAGAKGDPLTIGAILVALGSSGALLPRLLETVRDWLGRQREQHRVVLTIGTDSVELSGATAEQQAELLRVFLRRHAEE